MSVRYLLVVMIVCLSGVLLLGCSKDDDSASQENPDPQSDGDTDSDSDGDGDGDTDSDSDSDGDCPAPVGEESGYLWFSGYEQNPWDAEWGLEWDQAINHAIVTENVLFGNSAAEVTYPTGIASSGGGAQYRMSFDLLESPVADADEMYARYYIKFNEDVDFVLGGKLPGLFGGAGNTGGDKPTGLDGWSARIMWRANGRIVQYVYHPDQEGTYGDDLDWDENGAKYFIPGQWHCVETYIKMNTVDGEGEANAKYDGIVRSWLDGELALERTDLRYRYTNDFAIDGFYFSTFFGGSTAEWAPVKDEHAMFDNFVIHNDRIGCQDECVIPVAPLSGPGALDITSATLVFDGEQDAWGTSDWSNEGEINFADAENHTEGGSQSTYVRFDPAAWDAVIFSAPQPFSPSEYTHVQMWIRPEGSDVRFRAQLRGSSTADSADVVIDGSPTYHNGTWQVNEWQQVTLPIAEFASEDGQEQLLIRSDTNSATDGFWIDDIQLVVATPSS